MKNKNLHTVKNSGFKIPDGYFESFDENIISEIEFRNRMDSNKTSGFKVPSDYFETVNENILASIKNDNKVKQLYTFNWKKAGYITGVAASLIIAFNIFFSNSNAVTFDNLETTSIENYLNQEDFDAFDFTTFLTEDDLTIADFTETKLSDQSLENYLLQNSDLENLISD